MKKALFILSCAIITCLSFQSCSSNDKKIQDEVQKVLMTTYNSVTSTVKDGIITINGTVDSQQERMAVENVVRSVKGVKSVVNNITVKTPVTPAPVNTVNQDESLKSTISSRLNTAGFSDVNVQVVNGDVILTGDVKRSDLNKVMQIANEANPRKVTNQMNLK